MSARAYTYRPVGMDAYRPCAGGLQAGTRVVKVQPHGCPKNGTMGHCYVVPAANRAATPQLVLLKSLN